jgi:LAGLIDADG endonuclease
MAKTHSILPFPADIDRNAFGHWLSGFTDGEGCFCLQIRAGAGRLAPKAPFKIGLRQDDSPTLRLIQSFFGCGNLHLDKASYRRHICKGRRDCLDYVVVKVSDLASVVIPHFENYPLRAKKRNDFEIWKRGVCHIQNVISRGRAGRRDGRGREPFWGQPDLDYFKSLITALKTVRQFNAPDLPPLGEPPDPPSLFD